MRGLFVVFLLIAPSFALAQQPPPDPALMQKTIAALQGHRNEANDWRAVLEARLALATEEIAKLSAQIKELEAKAPKQEAEPHP